MKTYTIKNCPSELWMRLKIRAVKKNMRIKDAIIAAIRDWVNKED